MGVALCILGVHVAVMVVWPGQMMVVMVCGASSDGFWAPPCQVPAHCTFLGFACGDNKGSRAGHWGPVQA